MTYKLLNSVMVGAIIIGFSALYGIRNEMRNRLHFLDNVIYDMKHGMCSNEQAYNRIIEDGDKRMLHIFTGAGAATISCGIGLGAAGMAIRRGKRVLRESKRQPSLDDL